MNGISIVSDTNPLIYLLNGSQKAASYLDGKQINKETTSIIRKNSVLQNQYYLLTSVEGVGDKLAIKMIVETNAFKNFNNARKFCCHAGVAPFSYTSGLNVHHRGRISNRANKSIKKLLHMSALAVISSKSPLSEYYYRKVKEGKNKITAMWFYLFVNRLNNFSFI